MLSQKQMHKSISNKLMTVLSVVDLLQGLFIWPLAAANFLVFHRLDTNCLLLHLLYSLGFSLTRSTFWAIFFIALEQYIAILHPYFYIAHVTFYRLLGPMVLINVLLIIIDTVGNLKIGHVWIAYHNIEVLSIGTPIIMVLFLLHIKIIHCAAKVAARIAETNKEEGKTIKARTKAAKSGLIVLVVTFMLYFPNMFYKIYEKVSATTPFLKTYVKSSVEILPLCSSIADPIIYYWRLKSLRKATKDMFTSLFKRKRVGHQ